MIFSEKERKYKSHSKPTLSKPKDSSPTMWVYLQLSADFELGFRSLSTVKIELCEKIQQQYPVSQN